MEKLLFIDCCIRGEESRTYKLANYFLKNLSKEYEVKFLDLMKENLEYLTKERIKEREEALKYKAYHESALKYAVEFANQDLILIAAPFWDLSFPALLKIYIENICVQDISFNYGEKGIGGLCKARNLVFITSRGGKYKGSPAELGGPYIREISKMLGIENFHMIEVEGLDMGLEPVDEILKETFKEIHMILEKI